MITFARVNEKGDTATVVVGDKMFLVIRHDDTGAFIDYYSFAAEAPFKTEHISFDDVPQKP